MEIRHAFDVPVPVDTAWDVLLDVERVAPCLPGATVHSVDGDDFTGQVKVRLGPISLTYRGTARFVERDRAQRLAVVRARGRDVRGNGTAAAEVRMQLEEKGDTTAVTLDTTLDVTGRPAQLGRTLIADVGDQLVQQFASALAHQIERDGPPADARPGAGSSDTAALHAVNASSRASHGSTPPPAKPVGVIGLLARVLSRRMRRMVRGLTRRIAAAFGRRSRQ